MQLGKITYVQDLRSVWKNEASNFTPWLADNIGQLGEAIGLDLEVISVEHGVGPFSLDILARDTGNGHIVAIENQLEITDHNHLGQIITYASGVDANTVVWISKEIREEHRQAIDWLNHITNEELEFFAVEIQIMKVDDSLPAPFFKVKAFPNGWSKEQKGKLKSSEGVTARQESYHHFFSGLLERINKEMPGLTNSKKVSYDSWKVFPSGVAGVAYAVAYRMGNRLSCELYLDSGNKEMNKQRFDTLCEQKSEIEAELGKLSWERLDHKNACRIAAYTEFTSEDGMLEWAVSKLKSFRQCFDGYIKQGAFLNS